MKRLREHVQMYGVQSLSTCELIALVLSNGSTQGDMQTVISHLVEKYGMRGLRQISEEELVQEGLTRAKARTFNIIGELAERLSLPDAAERPLIRFVEDAVSLLRPFMESLDHEELRVLVLDTKNRVVAHLLLYQGTVNCCPLRAAEIFRHAIIRNCPKIIVCHNHPSGDPTASEEDKTVSEQLVQAGRLLDVELLDHIIIGRPSYTSLKTEMKWI